MKVFSMKLLPVAALLILFLLSLTSCHHDADLSVEPPKPPPPGPEFKCSHDTKHLKNHFRERVKHPYLIFAHLTLYLSQISFANGNN
jgi:hypothetical protein